MEPCSEGDSGEEELVDIDEKRELVESNPSWRHSIDFGDGVWSDGSALREELPKERRMAAKVEWCGLEGEPESPCFKNKTVLDVGAWDGFFSFYAERNGARSVTALDDYIWRGHQPPESKAGFEISRKALKSNVKDVTMDIMDATPENLGKFDVILFLGVLYHVEHPYKCIKILRNLLKDNGRLIIETAFSHNFESTPVLQFHQRGTRRMLGPQQESVSRTPFTCWTPNRSCLEAMVQEAGFKIDRVMPQVCNRLSLLCTKTVGTQNATK